MIQANQLSKSFGEGESLVRALKEIDLRIEESEMVSIVGPSGCGKTTLLQVLSGIDEPTAGKVWINGFDVYGAKERDRSAFRLQHTGFVFQAFHLIPVLSALENVALPLIGQGIPSKKANELSRHALEQVGLESKLAALPAELSGGQNQRVAIARAIVSKPSVIWADEPTGALDTDTSHQIVGLLRHINLTMGTTIVIVTHDPKVAGQCDRIIRMENGRITAGAKKVSE
ncbi:ABC transporter ATP-binding protein [Paenibacillus hodogayensis]|uniref:ABC transporter ATP-binding protein n=1 Tax=Paenibacillus hodogayensis TaxID=279208 RepID=A0ABV5VY93_9BACL